MSMEKFNSQICRYNPDDAIKEVGLMIDEGE